MIQTPRLRAIAVLILGALSLAFTNYMLSSGRYSYFLVLIGPIFMLLGLVGIVRPSLMGKPGETKVLFKLLGKTDRILYVGCSLLGGLIGFLLITILEGWLPIS